MNTGIQLEEVPYRIVFVVTGLSTGGAEMMLLKLCSRLDRRRFLVSVVSLADRGTIGPRLEELGISVFALGIDPRIPSPRRLLGLRRLLKELKPDLVQGWMYHANLLASLVATNVPVCWGVRQSLYELKRERPITRWVIRTCALLSKGADRIVYNSRTSAQQHQSIGFDAARSTVIANGFDIAVFCPDSEAAQQIRQELGLPREAILIGLIARYHPMKDHAAFLEAAAITHRRHPAAYFLMAGAGVDANNLVLTRMIEGLGIGSRVFLLGEVRDVHRVNAALDIASSSSAWGEGFANVIGEAMSCAVPCVVTDVGDSAEIVGDTGRVVPARDSGALALAWSELIVLGDNERRELGMRARTRVIANYSLGAIVDRYEDLFAQLITRGAQ